MDVRSAVTRTRSNRETTSSEPSVATTSKFQDVLLCINDPDQSPRLKKWAVKYRQSVDLSALDRMVFGRPLEEVMNRPLETFAVPSFVVKITEYLEKNGKKIKNQLISLFFLF